MIITWGVRCAIATKRTRLCQCKRFVQVGVRKDVLIHMTGVSAKCTNQCSRRQRQWRYPVVVGSIPSTRVANMLNRFCQFSVPPAHVSSIMTSLKTLKTLKTKHSRPSCYTHNKYLKILRAQPPDQKLEYLMELNRYWPELVAGYKQILTNGDLANLLAMV